MPGWTLGADMATPPTNFQAVWDYGIRTILRYGGSQTWKQITTKERDEWWNVGDGMGIIAMFEDAATTPLKGYNQGVKDGKNARTWWTKFGYPTDLPILYAFDSNFTPAQLSGPCLDYFCGVHQSDPYPEPYGGKRTTDYFYSQGLSKHPFGTYAWSNGDFTPQDGVEQYRNGVSVGGTALDLCHVMTDYPSWRKDGMALTDDDVAKIWAYKPGWANTPNETAIGLLIDTYNRVNAPVIIADVVNALKTVPISGTGFTLEDVETALKTVLTGTKVTITS